MLMAKAALTAGSFMVRPRSNSIQNSRPPCRIPPRQGFRRSQNRSFKRMISSVKGLKGTVPFLLTQKLGQSL
jgi:hypothetical protein